MTRDEHWLLEEKYNGIKTTEFETDKIRLASGEPLAYVIGSQPFLGLTINLDSHPLIPRVETEWWTEQMLGKVRTSNVLTFLDLCAGSGAIGCAALAKLSNVKVYFGEIDPAHKATIFKNIRENRLDEKRSDIRIGDLFEPFDDLRFDFIACNPPYIPESRPLDTSVTDYEPALALYAENDGLGIIRRIAAELPKRLKPGGEAWIECDSAHAAAACALFTDQGLFADILPDQYSVPRVVRVHRNEVI